MLLLAALTAAVAADPAREIAARDGANLQRPTFAADGAKLAYEANFHDKKIIELYSGDPNTGAFTRVTPAVRSASSMTTGFATASASKGGLVAHDLDWAPASIGRFVYAASTDQLDYDLYVGGGGALAAAPGTDGGPAWSPDGKWIAFTSARTGQGDLYLVDVGAVEAPPRRLTSDATAAELFVSWSPDSAKLVYVGHSDEGDNLWLVPGLDAAPVRLTDGSGSQVRPTWSPAGDKIAFYANPEDEARFDLYVVEPRAGAAPSLVAKDVVLNATGPTWTPDGRSLVAVLDDDDRYDPIVVVPVADPARQRVLELGTVGHGDLDVAKTADGKLWLAFVAQGKRSDAERAFDRLYLAELAP